MATQLEEARRGVATPAMLRCAADENVPLQIIISEIAGGRAVIPCNPAHTRLEPVAVGRVFRTKVNANIGRSVDRSSCYEELEKLDVALRAGADFVMDLSVGEDLSSVRRAMLAASRAPLGTVPIYEAFSRVHGSIDDLSAEIMLQVIREQAAEGVDFMTLHSGLLRRHVPIAARRRMGIVSRGGAITAEWMVRHDRENPLYTHWDEVLDICREHDVTLSLGDGLRPGCLADASDEAQFAELDTIGELVVACRDNGVQVMVEGPGHVPFNQIQMNMEREQEVCDGAPFYVLGPVVCDIAPGYDHITSCIGATAAATYGASLLCYVTPAEHLGLPSSEEVKQGLIAYRIAAHAGDIARGLPGSRDRDDQMADARRTFDWDRQFALSLDPEGARARYEETRAGNPEDTDHCSMCGRDFCAIRTSNRVKDNLECNPQ